MPSVPKISAGSGIQPGRRQHHADDRGEHDQQAHFGFGELQKIAPPRWARLPAMGGLSGTVDMVQGYHADAQAPARAARSKVVMQMTRKAAPALCRVASANGIPRCTMADPDADLQQHGERPAGRRPLAGAAARARDGARSR